MIPFWGMTTSRWGKWRRFGEEGLDGWLGEGARFSTLPPPFFFFPPFVFPPSLPLTPSPLLFGLVNPRHPATNSPRLSAIYLLRPPYSSIPYTPFFPPHSNVLFLGLVRLIKKTRQFNLDLRSLEHCTSHRY